MFLLSLQPEKLNVYKNDSDTSWDFTLSGNTSKYEHFYRFIVLPFANVYELSNFGLIQERFSVRFHIAVDVTQ